MVYSLLLLNRILIIACLLAIPVNASETQQFFFKHGFTAPFNQEYVDRVLYEPADVISKTLLELTFEDTQLVTQTQFSFYLIQTLDVYSTYRGLKYPCVYEANPVLSESPSVAELVLFKVILIRLLKGLYDDETWEVFQKTSNYATGLAVLNNFQVMSDAKNFCPK